MNATDQKIFKAIVQEDGKSTYVVLPFLPNEAWGERTRYHITGDINGFSVRGSLKELGEEYTLRLGPAATRDSGIKPGETVTVTLTMEGPQIGNIAEDVANALLGSEKAKTFFEGLPTFYRKNYIRWIEGAKREETRIKRIQEMMQLLEDGKRRK